MHFSAFQLKIYFIHILEDVSEREFFSTSLFAYINAFVCVWARYYYGQKKKSVSVILVKGVWMGKQF